MEQTQKIYDFNKENHDGLYTVVDIDSKKYIFLGQTGHGKTSTILKLKDNYTPEEQEVYSKTEKSEVFSILTTRNNKNYHFEIMDTPGFKETQTSNKSRSDEEIRDIIVECIDKDMAKINAICIFHDSTKLLDDSVMSVYEYLSTMIDDEFKSNCILILTKCEEKFIPDQQNINLIDKYINKLLSGKNGEIFKKLCKGGIVFTGAFTHDKYVKLYGNDNKLNEIRKEMKEMNTSLVDVLCKFETKSFPSKTLKIVKDKRKKELSDCIISWLSKKEINIYTPIVLNNKYSLRKYKITSYTLGIILLISLGINIWFGVELYYFMHSPFCV